MTVEALRADTGTMSITQSMCGDADLAVVGSALADSARASVLLALADGRALPASVLAAEAGVTPSTASHHLARLVQAGLVRCTAKGRYRYYDLAGPTVADLIETAARLAPGRPITSLRQGTRMHALRYARRCYDHLAGRLGVAVLDALKTGGPFVALDEDPSAFALAAQGADWFAERGITMPSRLVGRTCMDWTEQRPHLAGPLGRILLDQFLRLEWLTPRPTTRALRLTERGIHAFRDGLGVDLPTGP